MTEDELLFSIALMMVPGIGDINARKLVAFAGSAQAVFKDKKKQLLRVPGIGEAVVSELSKKEILIKAEAELSFVIKNKIAVMLCTDKNYPERLRNCPDAPFILYSKGNCDLNNRKVISVVGTRRATEYGREICNQLITALAERKHDALIVSGLAYGIDVFAHKACLKNHLLTVGVLAHGLSMIYPAAHRPVAHEMCQSGGALLSEFTSTEKPDRPNFVRRNRVIAGMADAIIVIESPLQSGALITAEMANSYNRDVFAFPGRIGDTFSQGCNKLIKTNKANLIESVDDIEYLLGWSKSAKEPVQTSLFVNLEPEEQKLYSLLREHGELFIDQICSLSDMPVSMVSARLLNLEFSGLIRCFPGKLYRPS